MNTSLTDGSASRNGQPGPAPERSPALAAAGGPPARKVVDVAIAALWRRTASGRAELLVARRHADAIRGGLWELPGGKVEPGEAPERAALREAEEEVGISSDAVVTRPMPLAIAEHTDASVAREQSVRLHAFLVEVKSEADARPLGTSEVRWIDPARIDEFEWPPANGPINAALARALASRTAE